MERKAKKLFGILMIYLVMFQIFVATASVSAASDVNIPSGAVKYVESHYESAVSAVKDYSDYYDATAKQLEDVKLGTPFIVYEIGESSQDEIYYYPILDSSDNIILLLSVMGTTDGWRISVSEEWVDDLKQLGKITSEFIFYKSGDNLYAENKQEKFSIEGGIDLKLCNFSNKSYQTKKQEITDASGNFVKADFSNNDIADVNIKDKYTPSFSSSSSDSKVCALYNKKGQGNHGLCWAASVATICNYRNGTNITARNVANKMGIPYDDGGTITEAQVAIQSYGVDYFSIHNDASYPITWSSLRTNIDNKYPVYASAKKSKGFGHAVTAYGYTVAAGVNYVVFWNSGDEKSITVEFKKGGTSFSYGGNTYIWKYSVCKYY